MVFTSPIFLFAFLPIVLLSYYLTPHKGKNALLLFVSLFFYAWGETSYVVILLLSIVMNFIFGKLINKNQSFLILGIIFNILLLVFYKYFAFILSVFSIQFSRAENIHLPLGISFFTFQAISYLVDVKRKQAKVQNNIIDLGLYISLFPQLIAGPIVRYNSIANQIKSRVHNNSQFVSGIERFSYGLAKKILIANTLAGVADPIFALDDAQISTSLAWLAIICFSFQIYFDFSAYSDMAIGLGRMFGFTFQENFNYPYVATSIKDFWRRWHISLSTWFRDYLYIPLGGNKKGKYRTYFNLLIVFVLCGFWHGASWNFLIWGLIHGMFLVFERLGLSQILNKLPQMLKHLYTLLVVVIAWVFFKIEDFNQAMSFFKQLLTFNDNHQYLYTYHYFLNNQAGITLVCAVILSTPIFKKLSTTYPNVQFSGSATLINIRFFLILFLLILSTIWVSASTYNPFIYFRF